MNYKFKIKLGLISTLNKHRTHDGKDNYQILVDGKYLLHNGRSSWRSLSAAKRVLGLALRDMVGYTYGLYYNRWTEEGQNELAKIVREVHKKHVGFDPSYRIYLKKM